MTESEMRCGLCWITPKDWRGDNPQCAFSDGEFSGDNWNCATANAIRDICYEGGTLPDGVDYRYCEDQKYATIRLDGLELPFNEYPLALWVSWYKNRGRTDAMWLLFDDKPPRKPTARECEMISEFYASKRD